ncbi:MAG: hypothetical protein GY817_07380 [bacterium]|nr:hypothetical protein [bacterium]
MKGMQKPGNMMGMMKQAKDMYSKMKNTQKMLKKKTVEIESEGVSVVMNGNQNLISLKFNDEFIQNLVKITEKNRSANNIKTKAEGAILKAINIANKDIKKVIEKESKNISGGLNPADMMNMFK